jgi:hypothetical protein
MKTLTHRSLPLLALFSAAGAIAHAHPGHDGHDGGSFTWDFSHLTAYPVTTFGFLALAAVAVWAGWSHLRSNRSAKLQSLRKSNDR